ncbi:MAG: hypothetical protein ABWY35_08630 [Pseudorhodoplanes sp.]
MPLHRTPALLLSTALALACISAPAAAQELEQVQGFVATISLHYRGTFANMLGSAPGLLSYYYRVRIADGVAQATVQRDVEAMTSLGLGEDSVSHSFSGAIGRPGQSDYGQFAWSFSAGTLTLLSTPQTGGFALTVRFMQSNRGILCTAAAPYVPDNSPATRLSQLAFGGQVVIADMEQVGSYCEVSAS